ncbi:unnamed protein product [Adineta steineri]|uniref:B box-type domain-containing protein n=1 Tax=Adineta steineri TaxID=433720 RepID=A0A814Y8F1_9BILA|nr:unnamed protein product [Adineta steineri]CAF3997759.1 unnamed protein product [Adineta steineri]
MPVQTRCQWIQDPPCTKSGQVVCEGCSRKHCAQHHCSHRQELEAKLDELLRNNETVLDQAQAANPKDSALQQIDEYEAQMIAKIRETADNARQKVRRIIEDGKNDVKKELQEIRNGMLEKKQNDDYFENDLKAIENKMNDVQKNAARQQQIKVILQPIQQWDHLIQIEKPVSIRRGRKRFD